MAVQRTDLGRRIAEARTAKNWKQKQLAAAVHVEPVTVSRWERGQHSPDIDMLEMIAGATERPLSFFVDRVDAEPTPADEIAQMRSALAETQAALARMEQKLDAALARRQRARATN